MVENAPDPKDVMRDRLVELKFMRDAANAAIAAAHAQFAKTREEAVAAMRAGEKLGLTHIEMAQLFGVHRNVVGQYIRDGKAKQG